MYFISRLTTSCRPRECRPWNSRFPSSPKPLHQSEAWCTTNHMKLSLICMWIKSYFHMKVEHQDLLWGGGLKKFGNDLLRNECCDTIQLVKEKVVRAPGKRSRRPSGLKLPWCFVMVYFIPLAHILGRENKKKVFFFYTEIKYCIELTKSARRILSVKITQFCN